MVRHAFRALLVLSALAVFSCAHKQPETAIVQQQPAADGDVPVTTPAEVPWKDMTHAQKGIYMRKVVTPKMREVFQKYDKKDFAQFGCKTCHGEKAQEREFKMPSPELPVLPASEEEFMAAYMPGKMSMVLFMTDKVNPEMAKLLGMKSFDPHAAKPDPTAFGCNGCHTIKGMPPAPEKKGS